MPLYHRIYPFRYLNKGQWNGQDVENFDYDTASKEVASSFSTSHARLEKYYELSRQFLNDDYFTLGIEDWVNGVLKPVLETQRRCVI